LIRLLLRLDWRGRLLACLLTVWTAVRPLTWLALVFGLPFLLSRAALLL
jgi:hypothetical protein